MVSTDSAENPKDSAIEMAGGGLIASKGKFGTCPAEKTGRKNGEKPAKTGENPNITSLNT